MKRFTKKGIVQKILIILATILLIEYMVPCNRSRAESDTWEKIGGVLLEPIVKFAEAIGDTGMEMANYLLYHQEAFVERDAMYGAVSGGININNSTKIPVFRTSPEKIFSNQIAILDINFFNPTQYEEGQSSAEILSSTIATWYIALRNIALVGMLSVLAYTGLRIILSSAAQEKAKYKQMLTDWLIGLIILFFMHYIMSFSVTIINSVTDMLAKLMPEEVITYEFSTKSFTDYFDGPLGGTVGAYDYKEDINKVAEEIKNSTGLDVTVNTTKNDDGTTVETLSMKVGLTALIRQKAQAFIDESEVSQAVFYVIIYLVLVIYTYMFLFQYLKRLIKMAFYTLIAPIVALSYPLDKLKDGKAQAFNMWLKEYLFNLILQPMHLILYTVLMGTVTDLVVNNPIYAIVALGFLLQAEKLVRSIFGIKGSVEDKNGSFVGGAMVMSGINALVGGIKGKGGSGSHAVGGGNSAENAKVRLANRTPNNPDEQFDFIMSGFNENTASKLERLNEEKSASEDRIKDYNERGMTDKAKEEQTNLNRLTAELKELQKPSGANQTVNKPAEEQANQTARVINSANKANNINKVGRYANDYVPKKKKIAGAVLKTAGKYTLKGIRKGGGKLAKGAAMAAAGTTLGMVGIAAGLASDEYSNVFKYGGAAIAGGAMIGKMAGEKVENAIVNTEDVANGIDKKVNNIKDEYYQKLYEDDPKKYTEYKNKKIDEEFLKDKNTQEKYKAKFGKSKYMQAMEKAIEYRKMGVTDDDIIISAMRLKGNSISDELDDETKIRAAMLAEETKKYGDKGIETIEKRLRKNGRDETDIQDYMEKVRKITKKYL